MNRIFLRSNNFMHRIPIRWRLVLVLLGLLLVLVTALDILILFTTEQTLYTNQASSLRNEARLAVNGIRGRPFNLARTSVPSTAPLPQDLQHATEILASRLASSTNYVRVVSPQGEVFASSDSVSYAPPRVSLSASTIQQTLSDDQNGANENNYTLAKDAQGNRQLVILVPLLANYHTVAVLQVSTPTQTLDDSVTTLRVILLLGGIGALGIASLLTFPLVSAALRPLVEIERTSRRIAEGELSTRLKVPPVDDEIGHLAVSFNRMVAQLEEAFKRQKRFVADASHELRTPLTALSGSLEMLLMGADQGNTEARQRLTRGMYAEVKRMHRLVEDLLALTRLDEGQTTLRQERIDVQALMGKIYEQALQLSRGQQVSYTVAPNTPRALADSDSIQQVLLNLVDNAFKFSEADGFVRLQAYREGAGEAESVVIEVQDNGRGIPPEDLPHIFDRFYRADASRARSTRRVGGNGLGLAIAQELVEAQGGQITISSVLNKGTTVRLRLPAVAAATAPL